MDTPLSESRFADMLEGWVEEEREMHDERDSHLPDSHGHDDDEPDGEHDHDNDDDDDHIANSQEHEDEGNLHHLNGNFSTFNSNDSKQFA